jgi:ATP-dependent helicase HrpB
LPGEGEIKKCGELLKRLNDVSIHPLYGQLSPQEQFKAILPDKNAKRKIVLATSIAETSLTIEGIKTVVDCGFGRTQVFDIRSGLSRLETLRISKDSAEQRAGRAGRLSNGVCYRMWTSATQLRMAEHRVPEILEADLCSLTLEMAIWGVSDIYSLAWLDAPPKSSIAQATEVLEQIGAIENKKITPHGKQVHQLACHPRLAHMLIKARELNLVSLATDIAALLEERDPLPKESGIDINLRIEALRRARKNNSLARFSKIEKAAANYRHLLKTPIDNEATDAQETTPSFNWLMAVMPWPDTRTI